MSNDWEFYAQTPNKQLKNDLKTLAREFAQTHRDYIRFYQDKNGIPGEAGYFYDERPNIGFLAAAAWRIRGWVALQEFGIMKDKSGKVSRGRADLFIGIPRGTGFDELGIEAKVASVRSREDIHAALNPKNKRSQLSLAIEDAKCITADYRIATVFVCPELRAGENLEKALEDVGEEFWTACKELRKYKYHWAGFSFVPKKALEQQIAKVKFVYPAVAVVMVGVE